MLIGEKIKKYRKAAGLTQKELGEKLSISQQQIAQYENGTRKPKIETLSRISNSLNIDLITLTENVSDWYDDSWSKLMTLKKIAEHEDDEEQKNLDFLTYYFTALNSRGQKKALDQVEMLTKIPEYRKNTE